ncbi:choice-of-anchor L domain-containing protein [Chryseobacterium sp. MYb328]|uniref:choice-of-anchor L domain-containing protein n=1 Tax=Chryseobacterium sp. MYb328 TaxID=2745231 RepID=UPI0030B419C1
MTRHLFISLIFFSSFVFSQQRTKIPPQKPGPASMKAGAFIDINSAPYPESNYDITQLVKDVLITGGSTCTGANVSNVMVSPNLAATNQNRSWGYFNKATTNFPFEKGIMLSTGFARRAGNNFQADLGDNLPSGGDTDLATALGISNSDLFNATFIEFDFVPLSTEVSFKYLFASTEYQSNFTCNFTDGFALLLKKVGDPAYTNLAVLPNGEPVSVTNIIPSQLSCGPKNVQYFGGLNPSQTVTNFKGRTIPLTAKATVIPGQTYHFKIVLADFGDSLFDSGVFLEAGSFDIGVKILDPTGVQPPPFINLCDNKSQVLTASVQAGNPTYQWSFNNIPIPAATSASHTVTQPGVYSVQVILPGNACPGTASITVTTGTSATVQNTKLTTCYTSGNAIYNLTSAQSSISTTPGVTFHYYQNLSDANSGNTNTIGTPTAYSSPGNQTIYVLVKNGLCNKVAELSLVKANEIITTITASTSTICYGQSATLTSNHPSGNTWSTGETTQSITITTSGVYTLTNSLGECTGQPASVTITAEADPNIQITGKLSLCNAPTQLTASSLGAGNTYTWSNGATGNSITVSIAGTYTVTVETSNGCKYQKSVTVTQDIIPIPTISASSQVICGNNSIILTSNLPTGNTWSTGETTSSITVTTPGIYTLTNSNGVCTSLPASVTITKEANPNLNITGNTTFCGGASTTLTATAAGNGNSFSWSNGVNTASNTVNTPGTYTVIVTTGAGCQYQKSITVTMDPKITVNIAIPEEINCINKQITLDATTSVYQAGATFLWTAANGGNIVSGTNTLTPIVSNSGVYTLTITNPTTNGCTKQASVTVTKNTTLPIISISASSLTICQGDSVIITASGATTYTWSGLSGTGNTQTVAPTITTTYSVTGTNPNSCSSTTTITIKVVPEIISTLHNIEICQGDKALLDAGPGPQYTYLWNNGATTQTILTNTAGSYSVKISNENCSKIFTATVSYIAVPEIQEITYKDNTLTIHAKNNGNTPLEYSIDNGVTWQSSPVFQNILRNSQYYIVVKNKGASCASHIEYYTFFMANIITPNYDGINDVIDFSIISKYGNFQGNIFDRYGKNVFKIGTKKPVWDGTFLDRPLPTGTYWYTLSWEDRITKKPVTSSGWILLKNRN